MTDVRTFRAAGGTDTGRQRDANEDRFHVDVDRGIFIVADGIGGHAAGETAAELAIAAMRERLTRQTGALTDRMREAITIANNEIHRAASSRPEWRGMACVLTAAIVDGERVVVGHVGDSRLYLLRGDRIEKITPDHSPVGEREDANELSESEAMQHPRRNEVYRDVGSERREMGDPDFAFITEMTLPSDAALLICSDGLTDLVPADAIRQIAGARAGSPDDVVRGLIAAANEASGKDNITVVFIEGLAFGVKPHRRRSWALASAVGVAVLGGLAIGANWDLLTSQGGGAISVIGFSGVKVVRPGESITATLERASPGTTILVEPGEYRERLELKDNVRLISRKAHEATIRLPGGAAEGEAAVQATNVANAELAGFRIVGDAATPLGVGVLIRGGSARLVDLVVSGATRAALDFGGKAEVDVIGSEIHENPGAAAIIRPDVFVRLTHNSFQKNALSERAQSSVVIEPGSRSEWLRNVFHGVGPESIAGSDAELRASLPQTNVFIAPVRPAPSRGPAGRGGRQ